MRPGATPRTDRGAALIVALVILTVVGILVAGASIMASSVIQTGGQRSRTTRALQVAEAGLAHALGIVRGPAAGVSNTDFLSGADDTPNTADDGRLTGFGLTSGEEIPVAGVNAYGGTYTVLVLDDPADGDGDAFTDLNKQILIRSTGVLADGSTATVETILGMTEFPALAVDGDLEISANDMVVGGSCGGVHTNGDITGGGSPTVTTNFSATGTVVDNMFPQVENQPPLVIPDLFPADYWGSCNFTHTGTYTLQSSTAAGIHCVTGDVLSSGDFGSMASMKSVTIIATGSIKISSKPFIRAAHPEGILLLGGGDLDLQGDWGGEGLLYAGGQCYVSSKPTIIGSLICKDRSPHPGSNWVNANLISGDGTITYDCNSTFGKRRPRAWSQLIG
jgi:hypothetical protein